MFGSNGELSKENVSISQVAMGSSFCSLVTELFCNFESLFKKKNTVMSAKKLKFNNLFVIADRLVEIAQEIVCVP